MRDVKCSKGSVAVAETCIEGTRKTGGEGGFRIRGNEWAVVIKVLNFCVPYVLVC